MSRRLASLPLLVAMGVGVLGSPSARADEATDRARAYYETGLELFYAREPAQALIEFQRANEVKPRPATLFMMGQCEYLLGELRPARDHYEAYLRESPTGEFVEVAKDRVESINRRPATLVINTVPDQVDVTITPAAETTGPGPTGDSASGGAAAQPLARVPSAATARAVTGQAPNNFSVARGRWLISVSKPNFQSQRMVVEVEVADTKPLFFKLEPIPARLEIQTIPSAATLYVNGNRVQNPYRQSVPPGHVELFAEAPSYASRTEDFVLGPGERRSLLGQNALHLRYVQRSGRPELLVASTVMGALIGAGALSGTVAAANETAVSPGDVATLGLTFGGALAGGILGAAVGNRFVPAYIPDNRALFLIGGMWIGTAEGALTGMAVNQIVTSKAGESSSTVTPGTILTYLQRPRLSLQLKAAFVGSLPGIVAGTTAGALLIHRSPTYGRVALIQSAAVGGALVGGLTAVALKWQVFKWEKVTRNVLVDSGCHPILDDRGHTQPDAGAECVGAADASLLDLSVPALIGLNVGLIAGILGAYVPDQSHYGPSWTRIALIDLVGVAGALGAGIFACVADDKGCLTAPPDSTARARTAGAALLGGAVGVMTGILLTRNVDAVSVSASDTPPPSLAILPMPQPGGGVRPMITALGFF